MKPVPVPVLVLVLVHVLGSCGGDDDDDDFCGPCDAAPPPDARPACELEDLTAEVLDGVVYTDCGNLPFGADEATMMDAHDCVVAASGAATPFLTIWYAQGIDSIIRGAYVGVPLDGEYTLLRFRYDSDPSGGSQIGARANASVCGSLQELPAEDCEFDYDRDLCLRCFPASNAIITCP